MHGCQIAHLRADQGTSYGKRTSRVTVLNRKPTMRIALVSDSISAYGGAERVIEQILSLYPQADIFAVVDVVPPDQRGFLGGRPVRTSFLQKIPKIERLYRSLLPLWPLAVEQFDVTGYDLVISSHHSVAYGVLTRPDQPHVSYVHSPMRYAWDLQHEYLREAKMERGPKSWLARRMLHSARIWDFCAAQRPETMVANSAFVANRLRRTHRGRAVPQWGAGSVVHVALRRCRCPILRRRPCTPLSLH